MNPLDRQPHNGSQKFAGHVHDDLKAYLDGELPLLRRLQVHWHLAQCAECREEGKWLNRLGEDMRDLERAQPNPELRRRILASLPDAPPGREVEMTPLRPAFGAPRLALAASCVALLAVIAVALPRFFTRPSEPTVATTMPERGRDLTQPAAMDPERKSVTTNSSRQSSFDPFSPNNLDGTASHAPRRKDDDSEDINRKAEQIFAARQRERARQEQKDWNRLLVHNPALKGGTRSGIKPPVRIAFAVSSDSFSASREDLVALTRKYGGIAYAPSRSEDRPDAASVISPSAPTGPSLNQPDYLSGPDQQRLSAANLLLLKIPAAKAKQLLQSLQERGKVSRIPADVPDTTISLMARQSLKPVSNGEKTPVQTANPSASLSRASKTRYTFVLVQMQAVP